MDRASLSHLQELMEPQWKSDASLSDSENSCTMTVKLDIVTDNNILTRNLQEILGFAWVDGTSQPFSYPTTSGSGGGFFRQVVLRRKIPARHPRFTWMRAKRITRVEGL